MDAIVSSIFDFQNEVALDTTVFPPWRIPLLFELDELPPLSTQRTPESKNGQMLATYHTPTSLSTKPAVSQSAGAAHFGVSIVSIITVLLVFRLDFFIVSIITGLVVFRSFWADDRPLS